MDPTAVIGADRPALPIVEWDVAWRALDGELHSGDAHVVVRTDTGAVVGAIDGLGHGPEAAAAARTAVAVIERHAAEPLADLTQRCHMALRRTRGAAMTLATVSAQTGTLRWLGVGNVEGLLFRADEQARPAREALVSRGGVVGYRLPPMRVIELPIAPGDTLILATDGIRTAFSDEAPHGRSVRTLADAILERYAKASDDALVLVVRYLGGGP